MIAICGKSTQIDILKEAGVEKADIVVIATPFDSDNLACAILARSLGAPRIVVRMRDPDYENAYEVAGVTKVVRMTDLMVNQMTMEIENPRIRPITTIGGGRANIFMVVVPKGARVAGKSIRDIVTMDGFPAQCIFIAVYAQDRGQFNIPRGEQVIDEGDELFLIATAENIKKVDDFVSSLKEP